MPADYTTRFVARRDVAPSIASFAFERPAGYAFEAGQFLSLTLETREGPQTKSFTHSSAPSDRELELTTRLTGSAFKDALSALEPGQEVAFAGPLGTLTVDPRDRCIAFLVGGVGVTPARSIIRDAVQRCSGVQIALFYGNQDEASIPFRAEFAGYAATHPEIAVIDVLAAPGPAWDGERGFITADVVRRHIDVADGWRFIVAGPPPMVTAMEKVIDELGVPQDRVSYERFAGYGPA